MSKGRIDSGVLVTLPSTWFHFLCQAYRPEKHLRKVHEQDQLLQSRDIQTYQKGLEGKTQRTKLYSAAGYEGE